MSHKLISTTEINGKTYELYESTEGNPEIFVDAVQGLATRNGVVKVNLARDIVDYNNPDGDTQQRAVACRLVMSLPSYIHIAEWLHDNAQEMKKLITEDESK